MTSGDCADIGTFAVSADEAERAAFCAATGVAPHADRLPLTFPMRWLGSPAVRAAILAALPDRAVVPVHEAQNFEYSGPLRVCERYALTVRAGLEATPNRLVVEAALATAGGEARASLTTVLRLIALDGDQ